MTHQLKTSKMSTKVISTFVALYLVFNVEGIDNRRGFNCEQNNKHTCRKDENCRWVPGIPDKPGIPGKPGKCQGRPLQPDPPGHNDNQYHHHQIRNDPVIVIQQDKNDELRLNNAMNQNILLRSLVVFLVYGYLMMNVLKEEDLGEKIIITIVSVYLIFFY